VPGIGAQGGTADDVRRIFRDALPAVIPSVSREVLHAGPDRGALSAAVAAQIAQFAFLRN
jgi:orotidine-5'-phosphate decarboxylase